MDFLYSLSLSLVRFVVIWVGASSSPSSTPEADRHKTVNNKRMKEKLFLLHENEKKAFNSEKVN